MRTTAAVSCLQRAPRALNIVRGSQQLSAQDMAGEFVRNDSQQFVCPSRGLSVAIIVHVTTRSIYRYI